MIILKKDLKKKLRSLRLKRKKIVFTNGVFDIIHRGHVDYLTRAKRMGDVLIVGLNSDASVRRLKGNNRPINPQKDRAVVLDTLKPVDYVVVFGEDTPEKLIQQIQPDVLAKGADYTIKNIVGAEFVKSYGGRVRRIALTPNRSTTRIVKKIR